MAAIKDQSAITVTEIEIDSRTEELVSRKSPHLHVKDSD